MLKLIDLSKSDTRWHNHRLKELCRLRELIIDELTNPDAKMTDFSSYFMNFNLLARKNKNK